MGSLQVCEQSQAGLSLLRDSLSLETAISLYSCALKGLKTRLETDTGLVESHRDGFPQRISDFRDASALGSGRKTLLRRLQWVYGLLTQGY